MGGKQVMEIKINDYGVYWCLHSYGLTKDNTSKSSNTVNASACLPNDKGVILNFPEQSCIKFYSRA